MDGPNTTLAVQRYLDELAASGAEPSDPVIRALLGRSVNRLQLLCGRLLHRSYPRLTRGPAYLEADDLVGAVVERLIKALRDVKPASVGQFFALANKHIRWELNDLARRIDQQQGVAPLTEDPIAPGVRTSTQETSALVRILASIEALPVEEREVFEYVRIQGMTHAEAAGLLGVSEKTVQRRLRRSVLMLADALRELAPSGALAAEIVEGDGGETAR